MIAIDAREYGTVNPDLEPGGPQRSGGFHLYGEIRDKSGKVLPILSDASWKVERHRSARLEPAWPRRPRLARAREIPIRRCGSLIRTFPRSYAASAMFVELRYRTIAGVIGIPAAVRVGRASMPYNRRANSWSSTQRQCRLSGWHGRNHGSRAKINRRTLRWERNDAFGYARLGDIAGFFIFWLVLGSLVSRRAGESAEQFFLAGRSMPWWLLGFSLVATTFAADTPLFVAGLVRESGVAANWEWWCSC